MSRRKFASWKSTIKDLARHSAVLVTSFDGPSSSHLCCTSQLLRSSEATLVELHNVEAHVPEEYYDREAGQIRKPAGSLTRFRALRALTLRSDGQRAWLPALPPTLTRLVLDDCMPIDEYGILPDEEAGFEQSRLQLGDLVCSSI